MNLLLLVLALLLAVLRVYVPSPGSQLVYDFLVILGVIGLPFLSRRRKRGSEFLTTGSPAEAPSSPTLLPQFEEANADARKIGQAMIIWGIAAALVYLASLIASRHTGGTLHACRQVTGGVLMLCILAALYFDSEQTLDLLLGCMGFFGLLLFLGPVWGTFLDRIWGILQDPFPNLPLLNLEAEPVSPLWILIALECWLTTAILVSRSLWRKISALLAHAILWGFWGALGGVWLPLILLVALLITIGVTPLRLKGYLKWGLLGAGTGLVAWKMASVWLPLGQWFWRGWTRWQPPFGTPASLADYKTALFRFPSGLGALGHEMVLPLFTNEYHVSPVFGGRQLLWLADLGIAAPVLSLTLLGLLIWSVRFVSYAYQELAEPSRDPEALRSVKESEYSLCPIVLPATLLAWWVSSLFLRNLDLMRHPVFWVTLGLWASWLSRSRPPGASKAWRNIKIAWVALFAVFFVGVMGMREMGRSHFQQALISASAEEQKAAYLAAQTWDRFNPEYSIRMGRLLLAEGRQRPEALVEGRLWLKRGIRLAPASAEGYLLLSRLERAAGNSLEAMAAAQRAVFFSPRERELRWELGGLYESTGRLDAAAREYRTILNLRPMEVEAQVALARIAEKEERWEDALKLYRQVLLLDRSHHLARARYEVLREQLASSD